MRMLLNPLKKLTPIPDAVTVTFCPPAACEGSEPLDAEPWPPVKPEQRNEYGAD